MEQMAIQCWRICDSTVKIRTLAPKALFTCNTSRTSDTALF